jgi:hypothetical protein
MFQDPDFMADLMESVKDIPENEDENKDKNDKDK